MNCNYCDTSLVRYTMHPSWSVCPKCEPGMFLKPGNRATTFYQQVLGHPMDMRGAPTR